MEKNILKYESDRYDGVTIDESSLPESILDFEKILQDSLSLWQKEKKRGIWLKIPKTKSNLIPIAINQGFDFHHCKPEYLLLTKWLPESEKNNLPQYSTHYIGIGGVVLNEEKTKILAIQESRSLIQDLWKIPGGHVEPNEFLPDAVIREVFEETGIKTEFISIISFRETRDYKYNRPDIYFVAHLKPLNFEYQKDEQEIKNVKWMDIDEFLNGYKISPFHSVLCELISNIKNKKDSVEWQGKSFEFKYGKYVRDQILYCSEKLNIKM